MKRSRRNRKRRVHKWIVKRGGYTIPTIDRSDPMLAWMHQRYCDPLFPITNKRGIDPQRGRVQGAKREGVGA